ncbi:MAG: hypothetical protein IPL84_04005 [Chitinophagaceae bacterium]|nr:hypothetical protein [Chitinophagaceae bacterium]
MEFFTEANEIINNIEYLTSEEKRDLKTMIEMQEFGSLDECKAFIDLQAPIICEAGI